MEGRPPCRPFSANRNGRRGVRPSIIRRQTKLVARCVSSGRLRISAPNAVPCSRVFPVLPIVIQRRRVAPPRPKRCKDHRTPYRSQTLPLLARLCEKPPLFLLSLREA